MTVNSDRRPPDINATTLLDWMRRDEVILVDVREPEEFAKERIPNALLFPLSSFDPDALPRIAGKKIVLSCFIGGRSIEAAERLLAARDAEVFNLDGGIFAWKEAGLATDTGQPRLNAT